MNFQVTIPEKITFTVQCANKEQIILIEHNRINITVSVTKDGRDGRDGVDGLTAYQLAINNGFNGTESEWLESLKGDKGDKGDTGDVTLVTRTLEEVRAESNVIEGNIDANGNTIENLSNGVANQQPATISQLNAALAEAKSYADTVSVDTVRWAGFHDASTGTFPTRSGIRRGDQFEMNVAGTIAGEFFEIGDLIRARINSPGQDAANWSSSQGNVQQATETRQGAAKVVTAAEVANENSVNDTEVVTSKKLWQNFWTRILSLAWTWNSKQTFTTAPRLSSVNANEYLKVDANKDVVSVSAIPAGDINESTTKRFVTDTEKSTWNGKVDASALQVYERFFAVDTGSRIVTGSPGTQQAHAYYLIPANTLRIGSKIQLDFEFLKAAVSANGQITNLKHNTTQTASLGTTIVAVNNGSAILEWRIKAELVIRSGNVAKLLLQDTSIAGVGTSTAATLTFTFDPTVDNYFFATTNPNNPTDSFTQVFASIKGIY